MKRKGGKLNGEREHLSVHTENGNVGVAESGLFIGEKKYSRKASANSPAVSVLLSAATDRMQFKVKAAV